MSQKKPMAKSENINIAIVGATGLVGKQVLEILAERLFPVGEVYAIASRQSMGREVSFGEQTLKCKDLEQFDFAKTDLAIFCASSEVAAKWAPNAAKSGAIVIDNSSHFRMDPEVPLIVPEVNPDAVFGVSAKNIIANPNCSTAQLVVALKPLHDHARIKRVVVSTYQSVSGAGTAAMDELFNQTKGIFVGDDPTPDAFTKQMAFNVIPHIDSFMDDGVTREEWKIVAETKKILDPKIRLSATCVRVPVFVGHSEAINIEFENPMSDDDARDILREAPGLMVVDKREDGGYITPVEAVGDFATYVSRIRVDPTVDSGLWLWCVSDNLCKGAALNAVQIAETLLNRGLIKG